MHNEQEKYAFEETCRYIHSNSLLSWITNRAYRKCARLLTNREHIVELGCGTGDFIPYCPCKRYLGIDISEAFINTAKETYPEHEFATGDVYDLPFDDKSFTSIMSFAMLEHLGNLKTALLEIDRVLKDDGEFVFGIPTEGLLYRLGRNLTTKRHVQKTTGVDYDALVRKEHVNRCQDILDALKEVFVMDKLSGVPCAIPIINVNVIIVGRCKKRL